MEFAMNDDIAQLNGWIKNKKGMGVIYTHPKSNRAIVDNGGLGREPGIWFNGIKFDTLELAINYFNTELNGELNDDN